VLRHLRPVAHPTDPTADGRRRHVDGVGLTDGDAANDPFPTAAGGVEQRAAAVAARVDPGHPLPVAAVRADHRLLGGEDRFVR
jgi:hypothetical protein